MKFCYSFLIILVFSVISRAEIKIEYRINKLHGLFNFVLAASDQPHTPPGLKEVFLRSKYNTKENQDLLTAFNLLDRSLQNGYNFSKSIPGRENGVQVQDQILTQSFYAKDLADLNQRTIGLMPINDQIQFFSILKKFEPIFEELVWKGAEHQLKKHKNKLEKLAKKVNFQKMFETARIFYHANWPADAPFLIGLYPIPFLKDFKNSTNSHSIGSVEEHGVLIGIDDDVNDSFGVIFHELCHSIYGSQSADFQNEFYHYFADSKQPERFQTYDWINEALATAIGNGWAYEKANQVMQRKSWYNDPIIDALSKEIFAETKNYLSQEKPVDKDFIENTIVAYARKFPDAIYSYDKVLSKIIFVHNQSLTTNSTAKAILRKNIRVFDFHASAPLVHEKTYSSISDTSNAAFIVFNDKDLSDFKTLSEHFSILKNNLTTIKNMKTSSFFSTVDENSRAFIVVKIEKETQLETALAKMLKVEKIDPKNPIQVF